MGKPKIVGIGELLWDVLPAGRRLGGAPVNFAFYAQEQGAEACIVSAVGQDASGDELLGGIAALGLGVRAVQRNAHPTSTVEVTLDAAGVPAYRIREQVAWDYIERTAEADAAVERYEKESAGLGVVKFVPASGAATRMFKELFEFVNDGKRGKGIDTLLENIGKFAFWPELRAVLPAGADDRAIVNAIVGDGLNYGRKPKGLVTFHAYPEGARKAVEEHLVEGAAYAAAGGVVRIHFTVSPEHVAGFEELLAAKVPFYEKRFGVRYEISFSVQKPSTDTLAVNPDNTPFRQDDGTLLFRPAGHGALIENLNEIDADLIFIKTT